LNIRGAVLEAFAQSAEKLAQTLSEPVACYFDGRDLPANLNLPSGSSSEAVIKGDAKIPEISAASVIAKVIRDKEMEELSLKFPDYDWAKNAGYGTKAHIEALRTHGLTPHHRESWVRKFL
jgi:ribonuclease HII